MGCNDFKPFSEVPVTSACSLLTLSSSGKFPATSPEAEASVGGGHQGHAHHFLPKCLRIWGSADHVCRVRGACWSTCPGLAASSGRAGRKCLRRGSQPSA